MTEQEIFDTVLEHLREQGGPRRAATATASTEARVEQPAPWDA